MTWLKPRATKVSPLRGEVMKHLEDAVGAVGIRLSEEEQGRLAEPYRPRPVVGPQ
jgi:hypothetical protein